jgi:rubredoxin
MITSRSVTVDLPDFKSMSDDGVQAHVLARRRDGRWSVQTRWLMSLFETDRLELNEAWAENWADWTCPACNRAKIEIARLTDQGVLLCQLDWHHDHLGDYARERMKAHVPPELPHEVQRPVSRAMAAAMPLIERFAETLLCNDCNAADAVMKAQLGKQVPGYFSFRPSEIARFAVIEPNRSHRIDVAIGETIWAEVSADVAQRIAFADMLGTRIGAGQHDREQTAFSLRQSADDRKLFFELGHEAASAWTKIDGIADGLVARSRSTAGRWSAVKVKVSRKPAVPDEAAFARLNVARSAASRWWRDSGGNWRCPCCDRTKFEIMRKSNKGDWTAMIMVATEFQVEADPASLARRAVHHAGPTVLGSHSQTGLCQDCRQILSDAMTIRPGNVSECLSFSQIRGLVEDPTPHARHGVTVEAIGARIDANAEWIDAVADYWAHLRHASDISLEHYRIMKTTGLSAAGARDIAIPKLVAAKTLPSENPDGWFDWWFREDERLRTISREGKDDQFA